MVAEVVLYCGRYFLLVGDVYVAMETDPCRDTLTDDKVWSKKSLDKAARKINKAASRSRQDAERKLLAALVEDVEAFAKIFGFVVPANASKVKAILAGKDPREWRDFRDPADSTQVY